MNKITVQCSVTNDPRITHMKLVASHMPMSFGVGRIDVYKGCVENGIFIPLEASSIKVLEHPELNELYDGWGWNVTALQEFIEESVPEFDRPELTTIQSTH